MSGFSDQVELTGAKKGDSGSDPDVDYVATAESGSPTVNAHSTAAPQTGVMKTVNSYVTY
jgi:hypothetical protein